MPFRSDELLIHYSNWKWPEVPGIENFKTKVHSAAWDENVVLEDKVVAVIGNGSSAVQIIPAIKNRKFNIYT